MSANDKDRYDRATSGAGLLRHHLGFVLLSVLILLAMYTLLRLALLLYNLDVADSVPTAVFAESFFNGLRFDLKLVAFACILPVLSILSTSAMAARGFQRGWMTFFSSFTFFLGMIELDFYREFHQRLNSLFFQYLSEDPATVVSMLWHGFPVLSYLFAWSVATWLLYRAFQRADRSTGQRGKEFAALKAQTPAWYIRYSAFSLCLLVTLAAARGTLQQGPPLRWGGAFTTEYLFANQLGLNGTLSLVEAAKSKLSSRQDNIWKSGLAPGQALDTARQMLVMPEEQLVDTDSAAVRRLMTPVARGMPPIRNVIIILLESFAGHYVGALGSSGAITPYFDRLSREGLLFSRFFANGTHTHQGMFATMACFPNLPGFEYLMQQPEGTHQFSGLPRLLGERGYDDLYVYNGDFAWDNQAGFFSNQGMRNFIGRNDYLDPVVSDPTWGVSDQDMFDRAYSELQANYGNRPFYALLQSLSNHTPYALPDKLPVEPVSGFGHLDEHLTAMRYSDWALGQFFEKARGLPYFDETLFVILGDHGFGSPEQLTEMDLYRFYIPMLLIAPGIQQAYGQRIDIAATQVDVVPTIMGLLGQPVQHQCWGRDLLALSAGDRGFGVIKPSGNDQTVALIDGDRILIQPRGQKAALYAYSLNGDSEAGRKDGDKTSLELLRQQLDSYLHTATGSLLANTTGDRSLSR